MAIKIALEKRGATVRLTRGHDALELVSERVEEAEDLVSRLNSSSAYRVCHGSIFMPNSPAGNYVHG